MPRRSTASLLPRGEAAPSPRTYWKLGFWPELDGLRAIAVTAVVLWHAAPSVAPGGFLGVEVFFALSGFLITCLLLEDQDQFGGIRYGRFYARRLLRLYPALILLVAANFVGNRLLKPEILVADDVKASVSALLYYSNWVMAFDYEFLHSLLHTWSLSIEEQFYLLWPLTLAGLLGLTKNFRRLAVVVLAMAGGVWIYRASNFHTALGSPWRLQAGLDMRLDALLFGCAAALLHRSGFFLNKGKLLRFFSLPGLAIILWWFGQATDWVQARTIWWGASVVPLATSFLILGLVNFKPASPLEKILAKGLSSPPARLVGKVSYGIYLFHFPILYSIPKSAAGIRGYIWVPAYMLTCFSVAYLSFRFWERPFQQWKDKRFA